MIEILFVIVIKILFFKNIIYLHQKLALFISSVIPILLKITLIIIKFKESKKETFIEYPWVTPIGIIILI